MLINMLAWLATGTLSTFTCWTLLIQRKLLEASVSDVRFNMRISFDTILFQLKNSNAGYHLRQATAT